MTLSAVRDQRANERARGLIDGQLDRARKRAGARGRRIVRHDAAAGEIKGKQTMPYRPVWLSVMGRPLVTFPVYADVSARAGARFGSVGVCT